MAAPFAGVAGLRLAHAVGLIVVSVIGILAIRGPDCGVRLDRHHAVRFVGQLDAIAVPMFLPAAAFGLNSGMTHSV